MRGSIPEVAELIQRMKQENYNLLLGDMVAAQKKGEIRKDINPQFILYFLNKMIEMAGNEQVINMYESTRSRTTELINLFFHGISAKRREDK